MRSQSFSKTVAQVHASILNLKDNNFCNNKLVYLGIYGWIFMCVYACAYVCITQIIHDIIIIPSFVITIVLV